MPRPAWAEQGVRRLQAHLWSGIQNPDLKPTCELRVPKSIHTAQVEAANTLGSGNAV